MRQMEGLWMRGAAVRRRMIAVVVTEGLLRLSAVVLGMVGVGLVGDWLFDWPRWWRMGIGVVYLTAVGLGIWHFVLRRWGAIPGGDRLALYMERQVPELNSRLISAVQLGRSSVGKDDTVAEAYIARLLQEAERRVSVFGLSRWVPLTPLRSAAKTLGIVALIGIALGLGGGTTSGILLRRALGSNEPLPRETKILEVTAEKVVGRGDDWAVAAGVAGVVPKQGELLVRHGSGRVQKMTLEPDATQHGRFERVLVNLTSSFRYRVRVNDAETEEFEVEVLPRPVVTNLQFTIQYPAYTGLAPRRLASGELTLLRGSRLRVEGRVSQALERATIRMVGVERSIPVELSAGDSTALTADLPVDDANWTGFSVELLDARGIPSRDPAVYAVSVVEDQPPTLRVILPARREELVTPRGTILVAFEAKDDYGLAGLRLRHQPAGSTNGMGTAIELESGGEVTNVTRRRFEWKLSEVRPPVTEGMFLEFWMEAVDRREAGGPGVGRSERYLARVVSEAEKRSDLLTRAGDAIGRLGDVAQGQERLNESLGRIILEKVAPR